MANIKNYKKHKEDTIMRDIYMSAKVITLDEENVIINFKNNQIRLDKEYFNDTDIQTIRDRNYCPGCIKISSRGFFGNKHSWCDLSRKIALKMT